MHIKQATQQGDGGDGGGAGGKPADPGVVDPAELATLRKIRDEHTALRAQLDADAKKRKEAEAAAAKEAEAKGDLQKALDAHKARLAELEPQAQLAQKWLAFEAAELKRIDEAKAKLPEAAQRALDAAPTLEAKQMFLAALQGAAPSKPEHTPPRSTGAGAPSTKVDFSQPMDPATLRTAKAADPAGWEAFKASLRGGAQRQPTTFELRRTARAKPGV